MTERPTAESTAGRAPPANSPLRVEPGKPFFIGHSGVAGRVLACFVTLFLVSSFGFGTNHLLGLFHARLEQVQQSEATEELTQVIGHLARLSQPESRFQDLISRIIRGWRYSDASPSVSKSFPGDRLRLFLFDEHGKRQVRGDFAKDFLRGSERYLGSLQRVSRGEAFQFASDEARLAESFSGSPETVDFLAHRPDALLDLRPMGLSKFGGWFQLKRRSRLTGYLLVWADLRDIPQDRLAKDACERLTAIGPRGYRFGAILRTPDPQRSRVLSGPPLSIPVSRRMLRHRLPPTFRQGSRIYATANLDSGICLYASRPVSTPQSVVGTVQSLVPPITGALLLAIIWGFVFVPRWNLPIRQQLVLIFGLAGFLGLGVLLALGHLYREARQESLIRDSQEQALQRLEKIDSSFRPAFNHLVHRYSHFIKRLEAHPDRFKEILAPLLTDQRNGKLLTACLVDVSGKIIFRSPASVNEVPGGIIPMGSEQLIGNVGKSALDRYNSLVRIVASASQIKEAPLSVVLERPVDRMLRERGSLQVIQLGGDGITTFVDVILSPSGRAWSVLMVLHDTRAMESAYLRRMARVIRASSNQRLLALPRGQETGLSPVPNNRRAREESVRILFDRVHRFGGTGHQSGIWDGVPALLSAIPGKTLQDFQLMLASPLTPIERRSRDLTNHFLMLAGTFILFTLFLAYTLAHRLLEPIQALSSSIGHLSAMRLEERVTISTGDELETIGQGINSLMNELGDLALAKTVQEHLLPQQTLSHKNFRIRGWSQVAGTLTGGYFDYQTTPEGQVALFLGETPEKGISSALIMAMVKIVLRLALETPDSKGTLLPEALMGSVNQILREHLHRPHPLRFICGILSPETGHLHLAAAGMPGFLHLSEDGSWKPFSDSRPLGLTNALQLASAELSLAPGDRIILGNSTLLEGLGWEKGTRDPFFEILKIHPFDDLAPRLWRELEFHRGSTGSEVEHAFVILERVRV